MTSQAPTTRPLHQREFWLVSVAVGLVAGVGAVFFRALIGSVHNLFFLGQLSFRYNANQHTPPGPWGAGIILVPVIGAAGVGFLVKTFAPEAKGHGVPEVMEAVYYQKGIIRPIVAVIKALASALCIGTGGSVGREGPIVQIGSSFGSTLGQALRLPAWQRITLVAAGAGGGIAATFNTPIGGILFAVELLLPEISARTLIPVALSTATATYLGRWLLGANPSFVIPGFATPNFHPTNPAVLLACVGLGGLLGVVTAVFIKAIYWSEDFFEQRVPNSYYVRHLLGMLLVGVLLYVMQVGFGHYYIGGVGYATVQAVLTGTLTALPLLLLLFGLKIVATSVTLGSGGSGGIFSPSLFLGATLGGAYGVLLKLLIPGLPSSPSAFAVVGMAGVVGSATGAAITAVVMIFEMTLDYQVILPMTIVVALSYGIRKSLLRNSIYTLKLARRGRPVPESLQANSWLVRQARDYLDSQVVTVSEDTTREYLAEALAAATPPHWFLIKREGELVGVIEADTLAAWLRRGEATSVTELARRDYEIVGEHTAFFELVSRTRDRRPGLFLVTPQNGSVSIQEVRGVISKERVSETMLQAVAPAPE